MPRFSVIVVDCETHTSRDAARSGVGSICEQTFRDFEVVFVHDGLKRRPYEVEFDLGGIEHVKTMYTKKRSMHWGHSLRDYGMRIADGEFIINFNIDNLLYP